jgi:cell division septum initiation protein DivIVA
MEALDKLEQLINGATRLPFTGKVVLNEDDLYELVDEIKSALPDELRQARQVLRERDRILERAREEAEALITEARSQVERLTDESTITRQARKQAEEILERARQVSAELSRRAREYADESMALLEQQLERLLGEVQDGRKQLAASNDAPAE